MTKNDTSLHFMGLFQIVTKTKKTADFHCSHNGSAVFQPILEVDATGFELGILSAIIATVTPISNFHDKTHDKSTKTHLIHILWSAIIFINRAACVYFLFSPPYNMPSRDFHIFFPAVTSPSGFL